MGLKVQGMKLFWTPGVTGATRYIGLHTADPSSTNELSGDGYARASIASNAWTINAGNGQATNTSAVTFATPTGTWDDATHVALWSAATGGNLLWSGALTNNPEPAEDGATVRIPANSLTLDVDTDD